PHFDWPNYAEVTEPRDAVEHVRKEYAAVVSKCDDSLGKVLDKMDQYQLWDDTLLIVCTDHGFMLGEHNLWAKCHQPFYNEIAHTPFFLWDPRHPAADERRQALIQTIDIAPTVLDYFQIEPPASVLGKPLAPCLESDQPVRQAGLFGQFGAHISVTDGRYVYMQAPVDESDIFEYTLMPTHMTALFSTDELAHTTIRPPFSFTKNVPVMKIRGRNQHGSGENRATSLLFDLEADPHQDHPIDDPEIKQRMIAMMLKLLAENDAPEEVYSHWGLK
ncbi:MAG: sulfatase-like hydrolase/transferase, partial [Anaerolineaceae bacterium]|nr:sulfatase-like hydrolase/transferase [Anaerolineaceae bacterium]